MIYNKKNTLQLGKIVNHINRITKKKKKIDLHKIKDFVVKISV